MIHFCHADLPKKFLPLTLVFAAAVGYAAPVQTLPLRAYGVEIGTLPVGKNNAITDVPGVRVGQVTLILPCFWP